MLGRLKMVMSGVATLVVGGGGFLVMGIGGVWWLRRIIVFSLSLKQYFKYTEDWLLQKKWIPESSFSKSWKLIKNCCYSVKGKYYKRKVIL